MILPKTYQCHLTLRLLPCFLLQGKDKTRNRTKRFFTTKNYWFCSLNYSVGILTYR